jgi:hypothetical protein
MTTWGKSADFTGSSHVLVILGSSNTLARRSTVHTSQRFSPSRRAVIAAAAGTLVGVVAIGVAHAQPAPPPLDDELAVTAAAPDDQTSPKQIAIGIAGGKFDPGQLQQKQDQFLSTLASKLGVSTDKLKQGLADTEKEVGPVPMLLGKLAAPAKVVTLTDPLQTAASALNISEDQLKQELNGKSLTDIARAHNVDPQTVANALKAQRNADLDQGVKDGKLTADMANKMRTNLDAEVQFIMSIVRLGKLGDGPGGALFVSGPAVP